MISGRRIAAATLAATLSVSFAAVSTSLAQSDDPSTSTPAPLEQTVQPDDGSVLQPEGGEVVHSWALAPAGSDDPNEGGNRPNLSYTVEPGTVVDDAVTLYNYGNAQLIFNIYATDAFNGESGELDFLSGTEAPTGVGSWVTFPQDIITVPAGQQATIPIQISIPDNAGPGDYTGALARIERGDQHRWRPGGPPRPTNRHPPAGAGERSAHRRTRDHRHLHRLQPGTQPDRRQCHRPLRRREPRQHPSWRHRYCQGRWPDSASARCRLFRSRSPSCCRAVR